MTKTELAYVAGIIDGEGTIALNRKYKTSKWRWPRISISNTDKRLIDYLLRTLAKFSPVLIRKPPRKANHRCAYEIRMNSDNALALVKKLLPYLRVPEKRRRAELLVTKYKKLTPRNGIYTKALVRKKEAFEREFLGIKSGGAGSQTLVLL